MATAEQAAAGQDGEPAFAAACFKVGPHHIKITG